MKKRSLYCLALSFVLSGLPICAETAPVKNVVFMLSDGTGPEAWPLARWVKGSRLHVDSILTGAVRTYGADSVITDSAPGATAFATGFKGTDKGISVGAWNITINPSQGNSGMKFVPLATLLEGAKLTGRATGLIATSNVQHASPAAFSSHWHDRSNYNEIAEQQVYQNLDVVFSGGWQYLLPKSVSGGKREDGENLVEVLKAKGYSYVTSGEAMAAVSSGKIWGAFAKNDLAYDLDRAALTPSQPSLPEMTSKALELLASNPKGRNNGFFLFVEGSKVDWAAHANDPAGVVSDLLAFDRAVGVALDFAAKDRNTLVVVVSDHGTGGLSIGSSVDHNYSKTSLESVVGPLRRAKKSAEGLDALLQGEASTERIKSVMVSEWGMQDLSDSELSELFELVKAKKPTEVATAAMLSKRARIGWTTSGHTGADVFMFAYGPGRPCGLMENTAVGKSMAESLGLDFEDLNRRLFVEAGEAFGQLGLNIQLDKADPANPVLMVSKGRFKAEMPLSKNLLKLNGEQFELEGLVLQAPKLNKVYVPRQAIELVKSRLK